MSVRVLAVRLFARQLEADERYYARRRVCYVVYGVCRQRYAVKSDSRRRFAQSEQNVDGNAARAADGAESEALFLFADAVLVYKFSDYEISDRKNLLR